MSPCPSANPADYPERETVMHPELSNSPNDPIWRVKWHPQAVSGEPYPGVRNFIVQAATVEDANEVWRKTNHGTTQQPVRLSTEPYAATWESAAAAGTVSIGKIEDTPQAVALARKLLNSQVFLKRRDEMLVYPEASGITTHTDGHEASFTLTDREGFEYTVTVQRTGKKRKPLPSVPGTLITWADGDENQGRLARRDKDYDQWIVYPSEQFTPNLYLKEEQLQETIGDADWKIVGLAL